jgi:hypothetical protein
MEEVVIMKVLRIVGVAKTRIDCFRCAHKEGYTHRDEHWCYMFKRYFQNCHQLAMYVEQRGEGR